MVVNIFHVIAVIGLISIILGTFIISMKRQFRRRYTYPLLIIGGICLLVYSIYINDLIFIILQSVFVISSVYGLIKMHERYRDKK
ncbi:YgjV family protein [Nanoarchaeota archaeon]